MSSSTPDADSETAADEGGPSGARARLMRSAPVLTGITALVCVLGWLQKQPCASVNFDFVKTTTRGCYTDIYPLYYVRGLNDGKVPYFDSFSGDTIHYVEYPVLSGYFMQIVNWIVKPFGIETRGMAFYNVTALLLALLAIGMVLATAYAAGRKSLKAGLMVGLSPALLLTAYINWDLLAVGLSAIAVAFWASRRPAWAGVFIGLAVAAKFYPLLLLWPFVLLCVRAGEWRAIVRLLAGTVGAWLAVNVPVMLFAWNGWLEFYKFNRTRGIDWGSIFFYFRGHGLESMNDTDKLNMVGTGTFIVLALAIGVLALAAPRRPRLPQLMFLVLVAFMLPNKVWSPQYVLWLLPLAVLARPRLPAFIVWQVGEIIYFFGIWWYLLAVSNGKPGADLSTTLSSLAHFDVPPGGISDNVYYIALFARFLTVFMLAVLVVMDILRPSGDVVRQDGLQDDPAGGLLDHAPDVFRLAPGWGRRRAGTHAGVADAAGTAV